MLGLGFTMIMTQHLIMFTNEMVVLKIVYFMQFSDVFALPRFAVVGMLAFITSIFEREMRTE